MHFALLATDDAARATGPDLTRYLVVCSLIIGGLLATAWAFRRFVGVRYRARAALRSLQVLDVLPLSAKQKLVVVRCYDRSFLLGLGEKEVRAIAELDVEGVASAGPALAVSAPGAPFANALDQELAPLPRESRTGAAGPGKPSLGSREGVLA